MSYVLAVPILLFSMMIQMVVINKLSLLYGYADLFILILNTFVFHPRTKHAYSWAILAGLMFGFVSKLPIYFPITLYLGMIWTAKQVKKRIWHLPILAYLFQVIGATFMFQLGSLLVLQVSGSSLPFLESINLIVIPSVILNFIFAIPIYYILTDFLNVVFPEKESS